MSTYAIYISRDVMDIDFPFKLEYRTQQTLNRVPHAHEHFQICYIQQGVCLHYVNDEAYLMTKGDLLAIPPFVPHRLDFYKEEKVSLVQVDFMPVVLDSEEMLVEPPFFPKIRLSGDSQVQVEQLLSRLNEEHARKEPGYRHLIRADLIRLLVTAFRQNDRIKQAAGASGEESRPLFYETVRYMETHFADSLKLEELAQRAAMSPSYFSYMFKVLIGEPFTHYLNELRIRKALDLLQTTEQSAVDISFTAGFNNVSHFNRMFRKTVGISPLAYRKQSRTLE
jgi:AraC-like DNA-binding protein/mannose-6-phosphate isomerase-like protein (cupin superfamily)